MEQGGWRGIYREIAKMVPRGGRISRELVEEVAEKLDEMKRLFVREAAGSELAKVHEWCRMLREASESIKGRLGLSEIIFPRELRSFLEDPEAHLRKKLFIYAMDLARKRIGVRSFEERAQRAVQTSLQTNLRSIYQSWVFLVMLEELALDGGHLIYPEHGCLSLERSGRQRLASIPPNAIIETGHGVLSFFLEAPRPIAWEDTRDLKRAWKLYKAMRPDILVYGGRIMNILDEGSDPPIRRPDVIIECKELEDWHKRVRELKRGDRPLSAEEWRWMWLQGLWRGLGRELGARIRPEEIQLDQDERIRLKEPELVKMYMRLYKPREMLLITRCETPGDVKRDLELEGIMVIDDVQFDRARLKDASRMLLSYAEPAEDIIILRGELVRLIRAKSRLHRKSPEKLIWEAITAL
ncbi:MAG: hypothetical protein L2C94_006365 [Aigarchaeota archaeon]|nr:hypothetical protein [Candidatus Wolframiiraptor gerlachensis]